MSIHKSVLLEESIKALNLKNGDVVVDATLGGGGHSREILKIIRKTGKLIAVDQDRNAINSFSKEIKSKPDNLVLVKDNFSNFKNILGGRGIKSVDAVLADLGFSSDQIEDSERGLSFLKDGSLDMRLDKEKDLTVEKIVNQYSQEELERILKIYGEEKFARSIAKKVINARKEAPIKGTLELARIIGNAVPKKYRHGRIHFATKTFQALRIEVNRELENLEKFIPQAIATLNSGGRLAIISFHSLEDRIVKNIFRENARGCICPKEFPKCLCGHKEKIRIITRKPVVPSFLEIEKNPRARSAKLRVCEKI